LNWLDSVVFLFGEAIVFALGSFVALSVAIFFDYLRQKKRNVLVTSKILPTNSQLGIQKLPRLAERINLDPRYECIVTFRGLSKQNYEIFLSGKNYKKKIGFKTIFLSSNFNDKNMYDLNSSFSIVLADRFGHITENEYLEFLDHIGQLKTILGKDTVLQKPLPTYSKIYKSSKQAYSRISKLDSILEFTLNSSDSIDLNLLRNYMEKLGYIEIMPSKFVLFDGRESKLSTAEFGFSKNNFRFLFNIAVSEDSPRDLKDMFNGLRWIAEYFQCQILDKNQKTVTKNSFMEIIKQVEIRQNQLKEEGLNPGSRLSREIFHLR